MRISLSNLKAKETLDRLVKSNSSPSPEDWLDLSNNADESILGARVKLQSLLFNSKNSLFHQEPVLPDISRHSLKFHTN